MMILLPQLIPRHIQIISFSTLGLGAFLKSNDTSSAASPYGDPSQARDQHNPGDGLREHYTWGFSSASKVSGIDLTFSSLIHDHELMTSISSEFNQINAQVTRPSPIFNTVIHSASLIHLSLLLQCFEIYLPIIMQASPAS